MDACILNLRDLRVRMDSLGLDQAAVFFEILTETMLCGVPPTEEEIGSRFPEEEAADVDRAIEELADLGAAVRQKVDDEMTLVIPDVHQLFSPKE